MTTYIYLVKVQWRLRFVMRLWESATQIAYVWNARISSDHNLEKVTLYHERSRLKVLQQYYNCITELTAAKLPSWLNLMLDFHHHTAVSLTPWQPICIVWVLSPKMTKYQVSSIKYQVSSIKYQVSSIKYPISLYCIFFSWEHFVMNTCLDNTLRFCRFLVC